MTSETSEPAEVTEGQSPAEASDAWRQALTTRRTLQRDGQGVPGAQATRIPEDVSRRSFILGSFWTGLGVSLLGGVGILLDFLYPRNVKGFGGPVPAGKLSDFAAGGEPKHCHGSTFTKAGIRVFGPAPRSLDTMKIDVDASGNITVQTGDRTPGGPDNPQRAQRF